MLIHHSYFKVIFVGECNVGKTSIVNRLIKGEFNEDYTLTIGGEYKVKNLDLGNNQIYQFQMWDTAGQEKFRSIIRGFFRDSAIVFLTYSIGSKKSFDRLYSWLDETKENASSDAIYVLVGNKSDDHREVPYEDGMNFMKINDLDTFFETSAKTGSNVNEVFEEAARLLVEKHEALERILRRNRA